MAKKKNSKTIENPQTTEEKEEALELALVALKKEFGEGTIIQADLDSFPQIGRIPSGAMSLDRVLNGGYPRGRVIEISGPESAGKTSIALHAIAECQKAGGKCAFLDVEHALDIRYAGALGVDISKLIISQPDCAEDTLNIVDTLTRSNAMDLIVVDSVAALVSRKELEGDIGDSSVGSQARLMSQAMRMLVGPLEKTDTTIIFLNQIRMKIGVMYGSPEVVSGGNALKFYASQRLDIRRVETLKNGDDKTGIRTRIKVAKNKVGRPFMQTELNIMFGEGIDWAADLLDLGVEAKLIERSGAWFSYKGQKLGQGTSNACNTIRNDLELAEELKNLIEADEEEILK